MGPTRCREDGAVILVPEVHCPGLHKPISKGLDVLFGGHGATGVGGGIGGVAGGSPSALGADLGSEASMVELLLLLEEAALLLPRHLLVHPLVLPLVEAAGKRTRAASHESEEGEVGEELRKRS